MTKSVLFTSLFVVFILRLAFWILNLFGLFSNLADEYGTFVNTVTESMSRSFILLVPALFILYESAREKKKWQSVPGLAYFILYGFALFADTTTGYSEKTGDLLSLAAFAVFFAVILWSYRKRKERLTFHHARLTWSVLLLLFGIADLVSRHRVELKIFSDYALIFCGITFLTQFLRDREKI